MSVNDSVIREATLSDAHEMAPMMREVDVQEIWASHKSTPLESLTKAVEGDGICRTWIVNGEIVCMFGVKKHSLLSDDASIWMLGTDKLPRHSRMFLSGIKQEIVVISENCGIIENWCDARNKITLKWLKWLGFTIEEAKPYGVYQLPFHHFYKEVA